MQSSCYDRATWHLRKEHRSWGQATGSGVLSSHSPSPSALYLSFLPWNLSPFCPRLPFGGCLNSSALIETVSIPSNYFPWYQSWLLQSTPAPPCGVHLSFSVVQISGLKQGYVALLWTPVILSGHQDPGNDQGAIYTFATWFPLCCFLLLSSANLSIFPYVRTEWGVPETPDPLGVMSSSPLLGTEIT